MQHKAKPTLTRREAITRARRSLKFRGWSPGIKATILAREDIGFRGTIADEKHHTPAEIAAMWALSVETIRRLFENEPDVLKMPNATGYTGRRRYKILRIPRERRSTSSSEKIRVMLTLWRRHNPKHCKLQGHEERKCRCPNLDIRRGRRGNPSQRDDQVARLDEG
jgi:hypothetical protein